MTKIIYEDNHLLVVEKPINMPVCEDDSKDKDLLNEMKEYIKIKYNKPGNVYLGLVHRLDRPVGGIMVFAKTSKAASRLSEQIRTKEFNKEYYAVVQGKVQDGILEDRLLKNPATNIVTVNKDGKESVLSYTVEGYKDNMSLVKIDLKTGRSHQIRVQFSIRNHPLYGDQKYNKDAVPGQQIALVSTSITFLHPITKEVLSFTIPLPDRYPFSIFK